MALVQAAVASAPLAWTITAPVILLALRFFPQFRDFFRASLETFVLSSEFSLLFLGYAYGVALFAPSVYSPLISVLQ